MADFCYQCTEKRLGVDPKLNDLKDLCKEGEYASALCEGCGPIVVDHLGIAMPKEVLEGIEDPKDFDELEDPEGFDRFESDKDDDEDDENNEDR